MIVKKKPLTLNGSSTSILLSEAASRWPRVNASLHVPECFSLELSNVLSKRIRQNALTPEEGEATFKERHRLPLHKHANERFVKPACALTVPTKQSLYECLYLALAEVIDGQVVTADRKFYASLTTSRDERRMLWVADHPKVQ